MLPILSGVVGNAVEVRVKDSWLEPLIIWASLVGRTGSSKSPALRLVRSAVDAIEAAFHRDHVAAMESYDRGYRVWKTRSKKAEQRGEPAPREPDRPIEGRIVIDDITAETVALLLSENPRGLALLQDEQSRFYNDQNRYRPGGKGDDAAFWNSVWSGDVATVDRKKDRQRIRIPRAAVSISGGIQPTTLVRCIEGKNSDNGLSCRFLYAMPPDRPALWSDREITSKTRSDFQELVANLCGLPCELDEFGEIHPRILRFSDEASGEFTCVHDDIVRRMTEEESDPVRGALSKLRAYVARIAGLHHLVRVATGEATRDRDVIEPESLEAATQIVTWFEGEARRVYSLQSAEEERAEVEKVANRIASAAEKRDGRLARAEMYKLFSGHVRAPLIDAAIALLEGDGFELQKAPRAKGRPGEVLVRTS